MKIPKKHNPFKTPNGYFEEFSQDLGTKLGEEKLGTSKKAGFKVPKDYFDTLPSRIIHKLHIPEPRVIPLTSKRFYYAAAASIAAAFLIFFGIQRKNQESASWDSIVNTDIETYFDTNGLGLTSYEIAEVISLDDLKVTDFLETELNEEDIIDYISENTDDFEELNLDNDE